VYESCLCRGITTAPSSSGGSRATVPRAGVTTRMVAAGVSQKAGASLALDDTHARDDFRYSAASLRSLLLRPRMRVREAPGAKVFLLVPCGLVARSARDPCYPRNAEVCRSVGSVSRRELHVRHARHTHVRCVGQRVGRVTAASGNTHRGPLAASGAMRLPPTVRACGTARLGNVLRGCSQRAVSEWPGTRPHDWRRHSRSPSRLSYRFRRRPSRSDRRLRPRNARS